MMESSRYGNVVKTSPFKSWMFILCIFSILNGNGNGHSTHHSRRNDAGKHPKIDTVRYNATVFVGQTAYLPCVVKHLGDQTVSWIRQVDLHIMTSGSHVYTSDPRVALIKEGRLKNTWTLKITKVKLSDAGTYECQVNTEPKIRAIHHLIVLGFPEISDNQFNHDDKSPVGLLLPPPPQPQLDSSVSPRFNGFEARILGLSTLKMHQGVTLNLTCIIAHDGRILETPSISWFFNDLPLDKNWRRGQHGINIETHKAIGRSISNLVIFNIMKDDEGTYSCGGPVAYPDSVVLHIVPTPSISSTKQEDHDNFKWSASNASWMRVFHFHSLLTPILINTLYPILVNDIIASISW